MYQKCVKTLFPSSKDLLSYKGIEITIPIEYKIVYKYYGSMKLEEVR